MDGIRVIRVWTYMSRNSGFWKRALDFFSFCISASFWGLFQRFDVCVATSPQFFTAVAGWIVGTIRRKPWVFELRDLWPESITTVGAMRPGLAIRTIERFELFLYRQSAAVVAVTNSLKGNLETRGVTSGKIFVVPNGANLDLYRPQNADSSVREKLRRAGRPIVGYLGTLGMAHALGLVVRVAKRRPGIEFVLIGDGAERAKLQRLRERLGAENVTMLPPVAKEQVPTYLAAFDYALVNLRRSETFKTAIPSKIFEAAAMRKPILLGVEGEACDILRRYEAGIPFRPEDEDSFCAALDRAFAGDSNGEYERMQDGCERLAQAYDRSILAKEMITILIKVGFG